MQTRFSQFLVHRHAVRQVKASSQQAERDGRAAQDPATLKHQEMSELSVEGKDNLREDKETQVETSGGGTSSHTGGKLHMTRGNKTRQMLPK